MKRNAIMGTVTGEWREINIGKKYNNRGKYSSRKNILTGNIQQEKYTNRKNILRQKNINGEKHNNENRINEENIITRKNLIPGKKIPKGTIIMGKI